MAPRVLQYTDYRKFLLDHISSLKHADKGGSYRAVCAHTGIKSAGHLSLILQGKANISEDLARRIGSFCKLTPTGLEYFLGLVRFNQAKTHGERLRHFESIISFKNSCVYRIDAHQYRFYAKWYHSVVRAMVEFLRITDNDANLVARMVEPAIRPDEAKSSLKLLAKLGLIDKGADGVYHLTQQSIDTGAWVPLVAVNELVLSMIERAREAFDRFEREERAFSWVTIATSAEGYAEILQEMRLFRLKAAQIAQLHPADRVYQVNLQMFPVSKPAAQSGRTP